MDQQARLLSFGCKNYGPLPFCPVQADLALESLDFDVNNENGPLVLGTVLTAPMKPFDALNTGKLVSPRPSTQETAMQETGTHECDSVEPCRFAHQRDEPGVGFNGDFVSKVKATSDKITVYSFDKNDADEYFRGLIKTEPVKKWLEGKRWAVLYMVDRVQVAKGLEISHSTEIHLKSKLGSDVREQMKHVLVPKLSKEVTVGYGLRKYQLFRVGFSTDSDWKVTSEQLDFKLNRIIEEASDHLVVTSADTG
ncbi:unnamed protein product [Clonostachys solani]|uniref:Uncharacterized protein n=1 Tax=Clonostachys solani TaxID=160281 RepID=A0A9N9W1W1_9HYPO|nr:unnamed protein product [Clonostachys solani]